MTEAIEPSLNAVFGEEASFVALLQSRVAVAAYRVPALRCFVDGH